MPGARSGEALQQVGALKVANQCSSRALGRHISYSNAVRRFSRTLWCGEAASFFAYLRFGRTADRLRAAISAAGPVAWMIRDPTTRKWLGVLRSGVLGVRASGRASLDAESLALLATANLDHCVVASRYSEQRSWCGILSKLLRQYLEEARLNRWPSVLDLVCPARHCFVQTALHAIGDDGSQSAGPSVGSRYPGLCIPNSGLSNKEQMIWFSTRFARVCRLPWSPAVRARSSKRGSPCSV